jgi:HD-GYP domain-containing protein (c-di-GMP phosphodiesterase class II)
LGARIISVADVYDAITTDRPYQKGKSREEAMAILDNLAGAGLDKGLVDNFKKI